MQVLDFDEIEIVSGGQAVKRRFDVVPSAQSDWGNRANDISKALGELGSSIGTGLYDMFH